MRHDPDSGAIVIMLRSPKMHGMVDGIDLLLDQRKVVDRIEDHVLAVVAARMPCDGLTAAADHRSKAIRDEIRAHFPPDRQTSLSAPSRWWHREGQFLPAQPREKG